MRRLSLLFAALLCLGAALPLAGANAQAPSGGSNTGDLDQRLERLEEQIVDLNAQLGTVETMSRGGGAATEPGGSFQSGGDDGRVSEIETQVRALSSQMGEIVRRLDQIARRSGGVAPSRRTPPGTEYGRAPQVDPDDGDPAVPVEEGTGFSVGGDSTGRGGGFGTTIEQGPAKSGGNGNLSGYFDKGAPNSGSSAPSTAAPVQTSARSSPQAQALYDRAYNALVQRNYQAASEGFEEFARNYSSDPLAGSAYFWLGEAAFTAGEYRKAADSFLKSSTNYPQNEKAAEGLLKLGISLKRLGENKAACSSFAELARRFPSATPVLQRAEREKGRAQC